MADFVARMREAIDELRSSFEIRIPNPVYYWRRWRRG